ncbi:recombinase family protein [Sinorhizobium meliloti]|uniref:Helix-turn-helix domain-containing protein n=1 Tax=Rhizobium meliloti TaxID=382 RepID=A0AAW9TLI6_RHIML|nr:recombinase family protein [Sinorhizobium meliloti]MQW31880.1 helix-turn-helix domain-containing protein [Sinorhizobium meliloti]QPI29090.1 recombinase family protein [Sinorhizobium meliloti]RVG31810.1 recombinase family protein [Sinorhizobium meliloti]RVK97390.1 recombinase family protein [Sinorhizobium meliloti]RVN45444.1 recombinase family protein [Sinorhizobium meliloti]
MSRTFAYCRVSTADQTVDNQILEIANKGFVIEPHRIVTETISGSTPAKERPGFMKLLDRLEKGDKLIVTKLDRLGRNSIDIQMTLKHLQQTGVEVHCLALAGFDLGSAIGGLVMQMIAAVAEFERELIVERTHAGLKTAEAKGKVFGRPKALDDDQVNEIREAMKTGATISALAKKMGVSRATVMRAAQ